MHKICEMELIFRNFMESRCSRYEIPILQSRNKNGVQLSTEVERIGRATDRNTRQDQAACQHAVSSRIIKKHNSKQEWTAALQRHQSGKLPHPACHCRQRRRRAHHLHHLVGEGATQYWKSLQSSATCGGRLTWG